MNSPVVFITITGMILSVLLFFYNQGYQKANAYLAGFFFLSSLSYFIQYTFVFSHSPKLIMCLASGLPSTGYLIGPFAFLYVRSILRDNTLLSKKDYLHFLLFFIVFIGTIPYFFLSNETKLNIAKIIESNQWEGLSKYRLNVIVPPYINRYMRPLHVFIYSTTIWILIYQYRHKLFNNLNASYDFRIIKKWILFFSGFFLFSSFIYLNGVLNFNMANKAAFISKTYIMMVVFSFSFVMMMVSLLFFPHILYGLPVKTEAKSPQAYLVTEDVSKQVESESMNTDIVERAVEEKEKQLQLFSEDYLQEINMKLEAWVKDTYYLKKDGSLSTLSEQLQLPEHHLSYYFNTIRDIKFTDWRNNLRVDYAKDLLDKDIAQSITMEALALKAGFASQTTFNRAFKNMMGITPSQYIKLKGISHFKVTETSDLT